MANSRHLYHVWANFWLKKSTIISILRNKIYISPNFYLPTCGKFALPYTSLDLAQNLSSDGYEHLYSVPRAP